MHSASVALQAGRTLPVGLCATRLSGSDRGACNCRLGTRHAVWEVVRWVAWLLVWAVRPHSFATSGPRVAFAWGFG
jgi:hypothetical protein